MKMLPFAFLIAACDSGGDADLSAEDTCGRLAVAVCQWADDCETLGDATVSSCEAAIKQVCLDENTGSTCPESAVDACADDLVVSDCSEEDEDPPSCAGLKRSCE